MEPILFIAWGAFGLAILESMLHGLILPKRLRDGMSAQSNIEFNQTYKTIGFVLMIVGLFALGAFAVLNVPN